MDGWENIDTKEKEGQFSYYSSNGIPKTICNYKNDFLNGKYLQFHENGKLKKESNYSDGYVNGMENIYDKDGNILFACSYENSYPVDGTTNCFNTYKNKELIKKLVFYENTNQLALEEVCPTNSCYDQKNQTFYDRNNSIIQKNVLRLEELINGKEIVFFDTKKCGYVSGIKSIITYKEAYKTGEAITYDTKGNVIA